jgi:hypothetical protein
MTPLTDHITLEEMTRTKPGISNEPPLALAANLLRTAEKVEEARAIWTRVLGRDCPVRIGYGYRCPALNKSVGGSSTSAHVLGLAADAVPDGLTLREAFDALVADPEFMRDVDQLIIERGCIHIGLAVPAHNNVPRHELRLDKDIDGVRHYPLYGIWTPLGVQRA